jgi:pimeloyl-ACP methyl ester carboxylesterase
MPPEARALFPWESRFLDVDGGRLAYLDEGPRDAPVVLCVHGNPTWSFYWRALVHRLSDRYRVVVPDHIGCGRSDKPQDWPYRLAGHVANLRRLIDHLGLRDIQLVVHDWGGAIGFGAAVAEPERFARLVVTNTAAFRSPHIPPSIASCRIPGFGALAVRGLNGFARAATLRTTVRPLAPAVRRGLLAPYDSWAHRIATLRFVEDIPMRDTHPSWSTLADIEAGLERLSALPMLILWGERDWCFTPWFRAEWTRRFPAARVVAWDDVAHYVMEDAPDRVIAELEPFLTGVEAAA